ncbi:MAG: rhomboid family intramembrane serine protease [Crocinitomicaceae bacterium]|nr:rhomboid family intramembrane serine protease [Crocinitomicaceae bacterium]
MIGFYFIIAITVLVSINGFQNKTLIDKCLFSPYLIKTSGDYKRMLLHVFIHADYAHLAFNMFSLFFLGEILFDSLMLYNADYGVMHFYIIYFVGGLFATIGPYYKNQNNASYASLGASGCVSAVVFAFILWHPSLELMLLFFPFPIPAYVFGPIYLALEFFALRRGKGNIAHDAHIGGAFFGIIYILLINPQKGINFLELISL